MKDGDFFSKIKRLLLNVTKLHRHVFENPGYKVFIDKAISFLTETRFPTKRIDDFHTPDR